jgi:pseudoazurin
MNKPLTLMTALAATLAVTVPAGFAADHQVLMLNKDSEGRVMQFEPAFIKIAPGDSVTFVPQDKSHNTESIAKAIPAGAEGWKGKINEEVKVTFEVEGHYAYKCLPHAGMGMVGLIQVGDAGTPDPAIANTVPGKGKTRMQELIAEAGGQ